MTLLATIALALAPGPAAAPVELATRATTCSPCTYSAGAHRRARLELARARWYLRRHRVTRPYRAWLASTRGCEARGWAHPYRAVDPTGTYRGAYQFDLPTWASVGGRGDPAAAPPLEQDYRAVVLLQRRGTAPWPVCGRA
jgi:hypothetical protein